MVIDERDRLREQNNNLTDAIVRMQRRERGMAEVPREPRAQPLPMPRELADHIAGYATPSIRKMLRDQAYKRHHVHGEPWDIIVTEMLAPEEEQDAIAPP